MSGTAMVFWQLSWFKSLFKSLNVSRKDNKDIKPQKTIKINLLVWTCFIYFYAVLIMLKRPANISLFPFGFWEKRANTLNLIYKQSQAAHSVWRVRVIPRIIANIWDFFSNYTLLAMNGTAKPFSSWQLSRFQPLCGFKKYKTEPDHKLPDSIKWCDSLCFHFADAGRLRGKMWDTHRQRAAAAAAAVGRKRQVSPGCKNRSALWWTGLKFTGPQDDWDPSQTSVSQPNRQWSSWDNRRGYTLSSLTLIK